MGDIEKETRKLKLTHTEWFFIWTNLKYKIVILPPHLLYEE